MRRKLFCGSVPYVDDSPPQILQINSFRRIKSWYAKKKISIFYELRQFVECPYENPGGRSRWGPLVGECGTALPTLQAKCTQTQRRAARTRWIDEGGPRGCQCGFWGRRGRVPPLKQPLGDRGPRCTTFISHICTPIPGVRSTTLYINKCD